MYLLIIWKHRMPDVHTMPYQWPPLWSYQWLLDRKGPKPKIMLSICPRRQSFPVRFMSSCPHCVCAQIQIQTNTDTTRIMLSICEQIQILRIQISILNEDLLSVCTSIHHWSLIVLKSVWIALIRCFSISEGWNELRPLCERWWYIMLFPPTHLSKGK